jgi:hypothetical protein
MGADDQCPMPHAAKGWLTDDFATVIVGRPLPRATPSNPPHHHIHCHCRICHLCDHHQTGNPLLYPPPPPPPPIPSSSAIERQRESQLKPRHVQTLVHAQDVDCEVGRILAGQWSHLNNRLPQRCHCRHCCRRHCGYGWRGGVGCGRGESVLCVVCCVVWHKLMPHMG